MLNVEIITLNNFTTTKMKTISITVIRIMQQRVYWMQMGSNNGCLCIYWSGVGVNLHIVLFSHQLVPSWMQAVVCWFPFQSRCLGDPLLLTGLMQLNSFILGSNNWNSDQTSHNTRHVFLKGVLSQLSPPIALFCLYPGGPQQCASDSNLCWTHGQPGDAEYVFMPYWAALSLLALSGRYALW